MGSTDLKKKNPFRILLPIDSVPGHSKALMKMYNEINVFMAANIAFILKPVVQGVILISKPYYLRTTFHKAIAVIGSDSWGIWAK